jgi:hypothetical protein
MRVTSSLLVLALALADAGFTSAHAQFFGYTKSTGAGSPGEQELSIKTEGKFGKRDGSYTALKEKLEYAFTPWHNIQLEIAAIAQSHFIDGVTDIGDRNQTEFSGGSAELKYRFLEPGPSLPFSAALIIEPEISQISGNSGKREMGYELETRLALETEIVPKKLYAAINLFYEPEVKHTPEDEWEREADFGISGAIAYRATSIMTVGTGLEYRRHYEPEFHIYEGDALFIGPSMSLKINHRASLKLAWETQVAGHATDDPRLFNLEEFSRQKAKVELSYEF